MIHKRTVLFLTILSMFMWSVLGSIPSTFATAHLEPVIEQMVTLVKSPGQILVKESWYHTQSKDERHDELQYSYAGSEEIEMRRMLVKEQGKKVYKMIQKQGKTTEETGTGPYQTSILPGKTLFQSLLDAYQTSEWTSTGTVGLDSKLAEKKIRVVRESAAVYTEVVYLEKQTGLPMKKEYYQGSDISKAPEITEVYFFEKVHDPAGAVFTIPNSQTHNTNIEHVKRISISGSSIKFSKNWHNPQNGDERFEFFDYGFKSNESMSSQWIVNQQGKKGKEFYQMRKEQGEITEKTESKPGEFIPPRLSSFQSKKGPEWKRTKIMNFDGKKVQVYKRVDTEPKGFSTKVAFVNEETGLPMKEEHYWTYLDEEYYEQNFGIVPEREPQLTSIYFFENVQDPNGILFKIPQK
ncbi:hypothetical protein NDK47_23760 [Brevibacillus ruminantium]|uniref:MucB/RseB N-terminal domain-containing protein n=1 Tax=Brevibacillus ruminantium TaxID=2950604 RepID=A0ABY4WDG3_9BACL|nr:hypothetical protein [Brevibacillus ruminantium]USG65103.1 hypothetical protein NDK47_23760 [Brevibacillus ruminantium]